jgi:LEA14-like dessication related protein
LKNTIIIGKNYLRQAIQLYVNKKVVISKSSSIEKVEHKAVALPYVLLENKSYIFNHFIIPINIRKIRLEIWNGNVMVGRVLYDHPVIIWPLSKKLVRMEVRLSHITAVFNLIRFMLTDAISMDITGTIYLRILWLNIELAVKDKMMIPRDKFNLTGIVQGQLHESEKSQSEIKTPDEYGS